MTVMSTITLIESGFYLYSTTLLSFTTSSAASMYYSAISGLECNYARMSVQMWLRQTLVCDPTTVGVSGFAAYRS